MVETVNTEAVQPGYTAYYYTAYHWPNTISSGTASCCSPDNIILCGTYCETRSDLPSQLRLIRVFVQKKKKALEEAERTKQLGYDRQREEEEEKARKEAAAVKAALEIGPKSNYGSSTTTKSNPAADAQRAAAFPRLGFGAIPGTGAAAMAAPAPKVADDSPTTARDKFGNQKAISYFGRNAYDPNTVAEAQTRLQSFQGATSISSNAYFGREEEEALPARDDDGLAARESAARDAMQRLMANPDVQNISDNIRTGALKLSDYLAQMSERFLFNVYERVGPSQAWHVRGNFDKGKAG
ncbi:hypothetical protein BDZ89DRAFT_1047384 [Hymenopellis radicata]|nr:hypothetical protein BDZ89DRAFT_1047384 [Hymenopellis radicata]